MRVRTGFLLLAIFFAGALTSSVLGWLQPSTTIEVKNTSGKTIRYLDLTYRGIGNHHGRIAENLEPGQAVTFRWATDSEASYRLQATFEDGTVTKGGAGYTSRGEVIHEAVKDGRVLSQLPVPFTFSMLLESERDTTYRE